MPCFDENAGQAQACREKGASGCGQHWPLRSITNQATVTWALLFSEEGLPSAVRPAFAASERAELLLARSVLVRSL